MGIFEFSISHGSLFLEIDISGIYSGKMLFLEQIKFIFYQWIFTDKIYLH